MSQIADEPMTYQVLKIMLVDGDMLCDYLEFRSSSQTLAGVTTHPLQFHKNLYLYVAPYLVFLAIHKLCLYQPSELRRYL